MSSIEMLKEASTDEAARLLLGCELVRLTPYGEIRVRIVETEAYDENDPASHTYRGKTTRNAVMFGKTGTLYVYFTYGMHYCCNVVVGGEGRGAGVLIRAAEPISGDNVMKRLRGVSGINQTNGPAKLCQALAINSELNGHNLSEPPLELECTSSDRNFDIGTSPRIGIRNATEVQRRFYIKDNPFVSHTPKRNLLREQKYSL